MARIFGFNITRSAPRVAVVGTNFHERSAVNAVKAAGGSTVPDGERFAGLPAVRRTSAVSRDTDRASSGDLSGRDVSNDPRELYWGVLPNKIQPKQALSMIKAARGGDLWQLWRLSQAMLDTWPKFAMASHQLREAVSYVKFACEAYAANGEKPTKTAAEKRDLVVAALNSMTPDPFSDEKGRTGMIYNFTDGVIMGLTLEEMIWRDPQRMPGGRWRRLPKASAWTHPRHFTFNQDGKVVIFSSATGLNVGDQRRYGKGVGELPNPNKMICSQFMTRSGGSLATGFSIQVVWWWCARQYGLDFVLKNAQSFGHPFCDVTYKPGMSQSEKNEMLADIVKGLGNRILMHPEGTTLNIEPAQNLGSDNPQRWIIEESDREVLYLLLGQTGSTISTPGKLGGEDSHQDVKHERVSGVAEWVAQNGLAQFAAMVLRVNYGEDSECPTFKPDFTKPMDAAELSSFCTGITNSKMPVKADEFYSKTGFTQPEPGDTVIQGGEIKIIGAAMTDDEKFDQTLDQQVRQAEAAQEFNGDPGQPAQARSRRAIDAIRNATEDELADLEKLVTAAERAPHANGEVKALREKLETLSARGRGR